jgi:lipopolysaccharide cholinephosphotransferase
MVDKMKYYKILLNTLAAKNQLRLLTADELKQLKIRLLETYQDIASVCKKYGLTIMLVGGSTLGAIRHKGYIPWDDDLDLGMYRDDFQKFTEIFEQELGDKYILSAPNYSENVKNRFPQVLIKGTKRVLLGETDETPMTNILIDIFIIENVPKKLLLRYLKAFICNALMFIASNVQAYENRNEDFKKYMYQTPESKRIYKRQLLLGKLFHFFSKNKWFNIVDKYCRYNHKTGMVSVPTGRKHYLGEVLPYDVFFPIRETMFEGMKVNIPGKYDDYLKNLYGDYMEIPPVEDREQHFIKNIVF